MTKQLKVRKNKANNATATEIALMVTSGTDQTIEQFDSDAITKSLQEELGLSAEIAKSISNEVTDKLVAFSESAKITSVTSSLIRDFINVILYEKGNKLSLKSDNSITIPTYDIVKLIEMSNKENGNLTHCPESINFVLAERIMKDYAFKRVYNKESVRAHLEGKIYIHDAGAPCRAYCSGHSIEYVKLNGIRGIENIMSTSAPANSAWTLARHICSMTQFYSGIFAGAIGWDAVNVFFAPMLKGWSQKKMKQLAQTLIFDLSQLAGAKGGQTSFTDFNIYLTIPNIYRDTIAVGNGGKFLAIDMTGNEKLYDTREALLEDEKHGHILGLRYKDFEKEAQGFARAIFSVIEEGDAAGLPFAFPKINMHINEDTFTTPVFIEGKGFVASKEDSAVFYKTLADMYKAMETDFEIVPERTPNHDGHKLLMAACKAASRTGCPYFIFDRSGASISQCCFGGSQSVLVKNVAGPRIMTFKDLYESPFIPNMTVFNNGYWSKGKVVKVPRNNKKMYKVITVNNKELIMTEDHLSVTLNGDKSAEMLSTEDYLLFNTISSPVIKERDLGLTYEQGVFVGAYLGDGSKTDSNRINLSLNEEKYLKLKPLIDRAIKTIGCDKELSLNTPYNNVYPCTINNEDVHAFIEFWVKGNYSYEKELNLEALVQSHNFRRGIIDGFYATDGGNSYRIYTTSKVLASNIETLLVSLGIPSIVDTSDRRDEPVVIREIEYKRNHILYCIRPYLMYNKEYKDIFKIKFGGIYFRIKSIEEINDYNDVDVYCFEMNDVNDPYFTLPNGVVTHNCRLTVNLDSEAVKRASYAPETLRFVGVQNVTINLPNCAIESEQDMKKFYKELTRRMDLAVKAHFDRTEYLEKLMALDYSPLAFYKKGMDGKPYVDLRSGSYLIGIVGLNECVYNLIGKQLHESDEAYLLGLQIISFMRKYTDVKSKETKLTLKLEETPAESCSTRLATMDKKKYGDKAFVKQNIFGTYYTNSIHFAYDCAMDYMERLTKQSRFHTLVEAGSMIHNWVGDKLPEAKSIYGLAEHAFKKTDCTQFTISPEFTKCSDCCETVVGLRPICPKCGGSNVVHLERVTGYYVVLEKFNHGKRAEHADRNKAAYIIK